jgi:hypothetical protein
LQPPKKWRKIASRDDWLTEHVELPRECGRVANLLGFFFFGPGKKHWKILNQKHGKHDDFMVFHVNPVLINHGLLIRGVLPK